MLYIYRVIVSGSFNKNYKSFHVNKTILKCRVIKTTAKQLTVSHFPECYGDTGLVRIPLKECFTELEDAHKEADMLANEMITELSKAISCLKCPADVENKLEEAKEYSGD